MSQKRKQFNGVYQIEEKHLGLIRSLAEEDVKWFAQNEDKKTRIRPLFEEEVPKELRYNNYVVVFRPNSQNPSAIEFKRVFIAVPDQILRYMESISYDVERECPVYTFSKDNISHVKKLMKKLGMETTGEFEDVDDRPADYL